VDDAEHLARLVGGVLRGVEREVRLVAWRRGRFERDALNGCLLSGFRFYRVLG
jgi:hypothetical protein